MRKSLAKRRIVRALMQLALTRCDLGLESIVLADIRTYDSNIVLLQKYARVALMSDFSPPKNLWHDLAANNQGLQFNV